MNTVTFSPKHAYIVGLPSPYWSGQPTQLEHVEFTFSSSVECHFSAMRNETYHVVCCAFLERYWSRLIARVCIRNQLGLITGSVLQH